MTRDLVIVRAGARSLHPFWKEPRSTPPWDLYVCPYQPLPEAPPMAGVTVGEVIPGPKLAGLRALLKAWAGWRDYRYVMLADDDLLMTEPVVTAFFAGCADLGAKLAQPALTENSSTGHIMVYRNAAFFDRRVSFVEIMLPCFRTDVLAELLWTLDLTETGWGWGLDALWPKLLGYEDVVIIDATPAFHTRPVGRMRDADLQARVEAEASEILRRFDCAFVRKTHGGRATDGRVITQADPALLYTLVRGYDAIFQRRPGLLLPFVEQQLGSVGDTSIPAWMRR